MEIAKLKGRLHSIAYDRNQHELLTIELEDGITGLYDELIGRDLTFTVEPYQAKKKSKNANAYMWELCTLLGKYKFTTKDEVYKNAVKAVGWFKDFTLTQDTYKTFQFAWERQGTAWTTELIDYDENHDDVMVRAYYGSSCYSQRAMSRLIDYIKQDCIACGIKVLSEREQSLLIENWKGELK